LSDNSNSSKNSNSKIVLDTFGGSGSTLIACERMNTQARICELDEYYCNVIIDRWEKMTGLTARKILSLADRNNSSSPTDSNPIQVNEANLELIAVSSPPENDSAPIDNLSYSLPVYPINKFNNNLKEEV
jgi:hypothetical protein